MTTDSEVTIQVATIDLRNALEAVKPHAEKNKTGDNAVDHRVRLSFDAAEVYAMATNGSTSGLAWSPIQDDNRSSRFAPDDGPFWVDLSPRQVGLILTQFTTGAGSGAEMNEMLELTATPKTLTVTDIGGFWEGERITLPQLDFDTTYPDIITALAKALAEANNPAGAGKNLTATADHLKLFAAAETAYKQPLIFKPTGTDSSRGFLVQCADRFIGTIKSSHLDGNGMKTREAAHMAWLERFPAPKLTAVSG